MGNSNMGRGNVVHAFSVLWVGVALLTSYCAAPKGTANNVRRHHFDDDRLDCGGGWGTSRPTGHALASAAMDG